ncbi:MAG: PQQ-like beta-propeller repeat protein [Planctomycetes bacterium]|nr:PQQ-like beta-propeller repeat protein [Planctomycetota bacterium]
MSALRTRNGFGLPAAALLAILLPGAGTGSLRAEEKKAAADWPQWRGPNRDGISPNSPKLLDTWPKDGPKQLWKTGWIPATWNAGGGCGGPTVADGKVFVYVSWRRPIGGGDKYRPFTAEIMRDWGYIPEMPEDLAKKIEEARLKTPKFNAGYHILDYWMPEKQQDEGAARLLKDNPEMDKYINEFLTTLDPKDAEKYRSYVKRRFCNKDTGCGGALTVEQLKKANAGLLDKESSSFSDGIPLPFDGLFGPATRMAWDRASKTTDTVLCLDAATGKEIWKKEFPTASNWNDDGLNGILGPASTPAVWGGKLYAVGVGGLYCLSVKDGALVWQVKGGGTHSSVLVADGVVVYGAGNAAYDAENGKELWKGAGCGNSSPVLWVSGGTNYVISGRNCFDLHTGKPVMAIPFDLGYGATPVISGDILMTVSGPFKLTPGKAELLWKNPVHESAASPLVYQDHVYTFYSWYSGDGWHCVDMKTGKEKWAQADPKESLAGNKTCSSAILADGKIIHPIGYSSDTSYRIEMLKATPERFVQLGVFNPGIAAFSSPSIANGHLYLRLKDGVACYDLTGTAK